MGRGCLAEMDIMGMSLVGWRGDRVIRVMGAVEDGDVRY